MALEATHVRFALALLPRLHISDLATFCSGAVYPDTRYVTGLDRAKTHGVDSPHDPFSEGLIDFERGWATHLLYDEFEGAAMRVFIPPHLGVVEQNGAAWIEMTAMKIVEDMASVRVLGENISHLLTLKVDPSPCGEDKSGIQKFFTLAEELYTSQCTLDDYIKWVRNIGASDDIVIKLQNRTAEMLADENFKKGVEAIFDDVVTQVEKDRR